MHNICYREYPESISKREITDKVIAIVARSGDRYGTDRIKFCDDPICDNISAAQAYIREIDSDFYGGYAVRYYDFSKVKNPKKVDELEKKIQETLEKKKAFADAHSVKNQKAAFIGCACCGSKLNRELLSSNRCPVCHDDLRSASTLNRLASYDKRIDEYKNQIKKERLKDKKKAAVMWLVKFEYHS